MQQPLQWLAWLDWLAWLACLITMPACSSFVIYATAKGAIHYFLLEDWEFVNDYTHASGVRLAETGGD